MSSCSDCGEIEPQDHDESWWLCKCYDVKSPYIDDIVEELFSQEEAK